MWRWCGSYRASAAPGRLGRRPVAEGVVGVAETHQRVGRCGGTGRLRHRRGVPAAHGPRHSAAPPEREPPWPRSATSSHPCHLRRLPTSAPLDHRSHRRSRCSSEQVATITAFVDIQAPPPEGLPTAHILFGTNQSQPAEIAAARYHQGLAPLIIATGGVNRHNGIVDGREFHRLLVERGVPNEAIRYEDRSANITAIAPREDWSPSPKIAYHPPPRIPGHRHAHRAWTGKGTSTHVRYRISDASRLPPPQPIPAPTRLRRLVSGSFTVDPGDYEVLVGRSAGEPALGPTITTGGPVPGPRAVVDLRTSAAGFDDYTGITLVDASRTIGDVIAPSGHPATPLFRSADLSGAAETKVAGEGRLAFAAGDRCSPRSRCPTPGGATRGRPSPRIWTRRWKAFMTCGSACAGTPGSPRSTSAPELRLSRKTGSSLRSASKRT